MKKTNPQMYTWMNKNLEVREISKYGYGDLPKKKQGNKTYKKVSGKGKSVFTKKDIKKGDILFVMGGFILDIEDENSLSGIIADKPIEISENFSIGPRKPSDLPKMPQHYVNHSCDPNAGFNGQIFMVAMKKIKCGTEVTYDYAMVMHPNKESDSYFEFKCLCGSKKCRNRVGEGDWKNTELQKKYDGYFQYYLQEKINRMKKK